MTACPAHPSATPKLASVAMTSPGDPGQAAVNVANQTMEVTSSHMAVLPAVQNDVALALWKTDACTKDFQK